MGYEISSPPESLSHYFFRIKPLLKSIFHRNPNWNLKLYLQQFFYKNFFFYCGVNTKHSRQIPSFSFSLKSHFNFNINYKVPFKIKYTWLWSSLSRWQLLRPSSKNNTLAQSFHNKSVWSVQSLPFIFESFFF